MPPAGAGNAAARAPPGPAEHSLKSANGGGGPRRGAPAIGAGVRQRQGAAAEDRACAFLRSRGLRIVARNVRYRAGEIDVVAVDGGAWVFVEVRCRARPGDAAASIDARKRGKIRRAAQLYLLGRFGDRWPACRFDVVVVEAGRIAWLPSAFTGEEE